MSRIEASGVRSSWLTLATKELRRSERWRSRRSARNVATPAAAAKAAIKRSAARTKPMRRPALRTIDSGSGWRSVNPRSPSPSGVRSRTIPDRLVARIEKKSPGLAAGVGREADRARGESDRSLGPGPGDALARAPTAVAVERGRRRERAQEEVGRVAARRGAVELGAR